MTHSAMPISIVLLVISAFLLSYYCINSYWCIHQYSAYKQKNITFCKPSNHNKRKSICSLLNMDTALFILNYVLKHIWQIYFSSCWDTFAKSLYYLLCFVLSKELIIILTAGMFPVTVAADSDRCRRSSTCTNIISKHFTATTWYTASTSDFCLIR